MEYKVLENFRWGSLHLEKGQIVTITKTNKITSMVAIKHYPEKNQPVHHKAVESMVSLKKLEEY